MAWAWEGEGVRTHLTIWFRASQHPSGQTCEGSQEIEFTKAYDTKDGARTKVEDANTLRACLAMSCGHSLYGTACVRGGNRFRSVRTDSRHVYRLYILFIGILSVHTLITLPLPSPAAPASTLPSVGHG